MQHSGDTMEDMVRCMKMPLSDPFINNFHVSKLLLYILYINLSIVRYTHLSLADTSIWMMLHFESKILFYFNNTTLGFVKMFNDKIYISMWGCDGGVCWYDSVTDTRLDDIIDNQCASDISMHQQSWSKIGSCNFWTVHSLKHSWYRIEHEDKMCKFIISSNKLVTVQTWR